MSNTFEIKIGQIIILKRETLIPTYRALKYRMLIIKKIHNNENIRGEHICYSPKTRYLQAFHFSINEIERLPTQEEIDRHTFKSKRK